MKPFEKLTYAWTDAWDRR